MWILHLQVNTFYKYCVNTCEYYHNAYEYCHNTCEYWAGEYTLGPLKYGFSKVFYNVLLHLSMNDGYGTVQEWYNHKAKCRKQMQDLVSIVGRVIDNCDESLQPRPFISFFDNSDCASIFQTTLGGHISRGWSWRKFVRRRHQTYPNVCQMDVLWGF